MKMTSKLAKSLQDNLFCLAISAFGGISIDEQGRVELEDKAKKLALNYVSEQFISLCEAWEEAMGEKWEIEE